MSETQSRQPLPPHFMREERSPALPPALEEAVPGWIASGPASLREVREAAFAALRRIGLPNPDSEDFRFLRVGEFLPYLGALPAADPEPPELTAAAVHPLLFAESRESFLVLVDGVYVPQLSRPGEALQVAPLEEALEERTGLVSPASRRELLGSIAEESDAAAALAMLFSRRPLWIKIHPNAAPGPSLQVLHIRTDRSGSRSDRKPSAPARSDAWVVVRAGKLSEARLLVRHADPAQTAPGIMVNHQYTLLPEEDAAVKFFETGPEWDGDLRFRKLSARLPRNARLTVVSAAVGTRVSRNSYAVDLLAEGAEAELNGAAMLAGTRQQHQFVRLRHLAPHGTSRQHFKTVAADKARGSVDGTIDVAPDAQLTNAQQLINNLMLSDEARLDSKPRLMIHADDVKCSHGATMGKLDPAQQFYLQARGLSAAQARALMTVAFLAEIPARADVDGFRAHAERLLLGTLRHHLPEAPAAAAPGREGG